MNYNILITGVAGFVGSQLAKKLLNSGHTIYGIDNLSTGLLENVHKDIIFFERNTEEINSIEELESINFYQIYHISGQSSGEVSFSDPINDLRANTESTLAVLNFCVRKKCRNLVYASSMSVYGDVNQNNIGVTECQKTTPKSFYAVGKLASEQYLRIYSEEYDLNCVALRLFNVYGPGQNMENLKQGMVSIFLQQAFKLGRIVVKGSLDRYRDLIYIDDVINAFYVFLEKDFSGYSVFNVGTGVKTTVNEIIETIKSDLGDIDTRVINGTPGDQHGIFSDATLIRNKYNWEPTVDFSEGIKRTINFLKNR